MTFEIIKEYNIKISLVIGCIEYDLIHLKKLLNSLCANINHISEIICVINNVKGNKYEIEKYLEINKDIKNKIKLILLKYKLFPGAARNYGINLAKYSYIAFLDVRTLPEPNWLENAKNLLKENKNQGLLGRTKYVPFNKFEKCFIASTYGLKPITTLPGSLFSIAFVKKVGLFIPNIRSSEDRDWILRAKKFSNKLEFCQTLPLAYEDLKGTNFLKLLKKWFYYYDQIKCEKISVYNFQRLVYISYFLMILVLIIIFLATIIFPKLSFLRLNYFLINEIILTSLLCFYFILRFIYLPIKKGFNIFRNSLFDFFNIIFISISIDLVKTFVFIKATLRGFR